MEKICVDDICENPCSRISPHLMVCDCPLIDPDTGFASDDRCQLCCYDFNLVRVNAVMILIWLGTILSVLFQIFNFFSFVLSKNKNNNLELTLKLLKYTKKEN